MNQMGTEQTDRKHNIPRHIAVIMDGNGRWAQKRGLPRTAGHRAGMKTLKQTVRWCVDTGVEHLTVYAFSTENWKRPGDEVSFLMNLMIEMMKREIEELDRKGVKICVLGDLEPVPEGTREAIRQGVERTAGNTTLQLNIAFNYGGRQDILQAVRRIASEGVPPAEITEETFGNFLYTEGIPDPDLVIRTSGELRISNFLLWQIAYAEIVIADVLWPDFDRAEFDRALSAYGSRRRRYGGLDDDNR